MGPNSIRSALWMGANTCNLSRTDRGRAATSLYVLSIAYSIDYGTNGHIMRVLPRHYGFQRRHTALLVENWLWKPREDGSWDITDWSPRDFSTVRRRAAIPT